MNNRSGLILLAATLLALAGCAGTKSPSATTTSPSQAMPDVQVQGGTTPLPGASEPAPLEPVPNVGMSGNRAVVALLDHADEDNKAGRRDAAGALLERALRIEPRNPWLWHQLAQVRLAQGQYAQAITLARKSNSFGSKQLRVQAENWQVIGQAKSAQGDTLGAEQALQRATELAQQARNEVGLR